MIVRRFILAYNIDIIEHGSLGGHAFEILYIFLREFVPIDWWFSIWLSLLLWPWLASEAEGLKPATLYLNYYAFSLVTTD